MCILGICLCPSSPAAATAAAASATMRRFPVVIVNNRDEYINRPTTPFMIDEHTGIACFRDGLAGGTWMGMNLRTRTFAALTNSRDSYNGRKGAESRGQLIIRALLPHSSSSAAAPAPQPHDEAFDNGGFDGFNFVSCADLAAVASGSESLLFSTNRVKESEDPAKVTPPRAVPLSVPGVHVVSNTFIDNWREPKTRYLRDSLTAVMADGAIATQPVEEGLLSRVGDILCSRNCDTCLRQNSPRGADDDLDLETEAAEGVEKRYAGAAHIFDAGVEDENGVHATRTQSVVIVERVGEEGYTTAAASPFRIHYFVRDVDGVTHDLGPWRDTLASTAA